MKRFLAMVLLMVLCFGAAAEGSSVAGYTQEGGYLYASFGRYPQTADGGETPILWRVLRVAGGTAWLLSEYVLDTHPVQQDAAGFDGWGTSELRLWLNETFAQVAFDETQREALAADSQGDRVSLPDADLLKDAEQGFARDSDRMAAGTEHALAQGLKRYGPKEAAYWMSTRSTNNPRAQRVVNAGGRSGFLNVASNNIGVRPLIGVAIDALQIIAGSGTLADPYQLSASPEAMEQARLAREAEEEAARQAEEARLEQERLKAEAEQQALQAAQQALKIAQDAVTAARAAGENAEKLTALEAEVTEKQEALNRLTMTEREGFPMLTLEGFLPEGQPEYVFEDAENGIWRYANQDLLIEITRTSREGPVRYLAAEVILREGAPGFRMVPHNKKNMLVDAKRYVEKPAIIAQNNNLVFTIDGDYFLYRIGRRRTVKTFAVGVVIRDGEILMDSPPIESRNTYPPLDMLALYANGDMRAYKARERTAQELIAEGAVDVLSFGPYLIRNGEINTSYSSYGTSLQPRAAVGMVKKGHFWCVIVEGRIDESRGMTTRQVGDLMAELGCEMAFNLDGGWTSAMVFMGKQLNQLDRTGVRDNARPQNEVMGIGVTDAFN